MHRPEFRSIKKAALEAAFYFALIQQLLDFRFRVHHVFAHDRVELLYFHLVWRSSLVLVGGIEMAGSGAGYQFNLVAHDYALVILCCVPNSGLALDLDA